MNNDLLNLIELNNILNEKYKLKTKIISKDVDIYTINRIYIQ